VAAIFVDFPKNKCNFMHKNERDIVRRVQFLTGRSPMRSFSLDAVANIAPWMLAPMAHDEAIVHNNETPIRVYGRVYDTTRYDVGYLREFRNRQVAESNVKKVVHTRLPSVGFRS